MQFFSKFALAAIFSSTIANAHMVMKSPKPFGTPSNSPLDASGSDFPCKGGPYDRSSVSNTMAIGEPQELSFTGSAVHGGGSCQVSLTTDLQPTKDSKWMVIKSIEGGCPASVAGNLPADPNGSGASTFQYTIPDGIAPGEYVIAWTWVNKIGNREFYMNCGPATVTGAKKKRYAPAGVSLARRQSSFPDMFVANIASVNDCTTPESFDYNYPNPGEEVQSAGSGPYTNLACGAAGGNNPAPQPTGAAGGSGSGSGTQPTGSPASPTGGADSGAGSPGAGSPGAGSPGAGSPGAGSPGAGSPGQGGQGGQGQGQGGQGGNGGMGGNGQGGQGGQGQGQGGQGGARTGAPGSFATGAAPLPSEVGAAPESGSGADAGTGSGAGAESPAASGAAGSTGAAPPAAGSTGTATPPASGGASISGGQSGACTEEGAWVCLPGGQQYQRCGSGQWTPPQAVAAGTQCTPGGATTNFQISRVGGPKYKREPKRLVA